MSNHSVIEHRANYHFLKIEEDYVLICSSGEQYPQCKAAILAILEHWVNDKKSKGQETCVYMTYPEWIDAMYGLFRRSTIIACLNELISEGLISRNPCRRHGKDTYQYILHVQVVQERLKQLAERVEKYTRPNLNASKFKRVQKQTDVNLDGNTHSNLNGSSTDAFKFGHNIDSITEIPSNINSEVASQHFDATPLVPSENKNVSHFGHNAWNCEAYCNAHHATCADYQTYIDSGQREETPTEPRTPAIAIGATDGRQDRDATGRDSVPVGHPGTAGDTRQETHVAIGATHATSTTDRQYSHPSSRSVDRLPVEETPVKQTSLPAREAQSAPPDALSSHEQQDGAATAQWTGSESRPSDKGVTQASQKPLSLKEDEPTVRPETAAQRKRRIEAREKEIWALVEAGLRTKFTRTHRQLKANTTGMERLIEDETNDETIKTALDRLSDFWKNQFDLSMFHAKLPGLVRKQTRRLADKSPQNVLDAQYEAALEKTGQSLDDSERRSDFDIYVGNGPEARRKLVEDGMKLVAQGKYTDM